MKLLNDFYMVSGEKLTHRFDATGYLLKCKDFSVMIDCGTPNGYEQLIKNIKSIGEDPKNIRYIFGTHGHYDHVGAGHLFKENYGSQICLHEEDVERVEKGDDMATTAGLLYGEKFTPFKVDKHLKGGEVFDFAPYTLEVIHTPGHTPGSVCYVLKIDGLEVLIAGDTLYGGFSDRIGSDEKRWEDSLDILCRRHFDLMVIGHCNPTLMADCSVRLDDARRSFAIYYNPWFKDFYHKYTY